MGTAMYTGVSGLLANQDRMDVVANNVANINTYGYRGSRTTFQDVFSETLQGATTVTNPEQIGNGVTVGSIDIDFGQGTLTSTGVDSDLAIEGNGFFILSDGTSSFYTRDGSFSRDTNGVLVEPGTGLSVQGYMADETGAISASATLGDITIPIGSASIVNATENVLFTGNLDSGADTDSTISRTLTVYDSLGTEREVELTFTKHAEVTVDGTAYNAWTWSASIDGTDVGAVDSDQTGCILYDSTGAFYAEGEIDTSGTFTARADMTSQNEISIPASAITDGSTPTTPFEFNLDFSATTGQSGSTDVTMKSQDGYERGVLQSFSVGEDGVISGTFSNGVSQVIGQVALANFDNLGGLSRTGDNLFVATVASGLAQVGVAGTGGLGSIMGGELEGSNVDLSTEFSNMIVTQRAYQANSRTVTAADTILQETINLIR